MLKITVVCQKNAFSPKNVFEYLYINHSRSRDLRIYGNLSTLQKAARLALKKGIRGSASGPTTQARMFVPKFWFAIKKVI